MRTAPSSAVNTFGKMVLPSQFSPRMIKKTFLSVSQAERILRTNVFPASEEYRLIHEVCLSVLKEDIPADRDYPPFDRVMMDGVAISLQAYRQGQRKFHIQSTQRAGMRPQTLRDSMSGIEVMTGSVLPKGCDVVIPYEDLKIFGPTTVVPEGMRLRNKQYIHVQGRDYRKSDLLLRKNQILFPSHLALLASAGKARVRVSAPSIAVIDTGDELVDLDTKVRSHQLRRSNSYVIQAALGDHGFRKVTLFHWRDQHAKIVSALSEAFRKFDVILISGGVSMGKWDLIPWALKQLGIPIIFRGVCQRPGKPFLFARSRAGRPVFGLPGNPVSTQVTLYRYCIPYLRMSCGAGWPKAEYARIQKPFISAENLTIFRPARLTLNRQGVLQAHCFPLSCSGDFASFSKAHAFVEFPPGVNNFPAGYAARIFRMKRN